MNRTEARDIIINALVIATATDLANNETLRITSARAGLRAIESMSESDLVAAAFTTPGVMNGGSDTATALIMLGAEDDGICIVYGIDQATYLVSNRFDNGKVPQDIIDALRAKYAETAVVA